MQGHWLDPGLYQLFFAYFLLISPILTAYDSFPTQAKSKNITISIFKENLGELVFLLI